MYQAGPCSHAGSSDDHGCAEEAISTHRVCPTPRKICRSRLVAAAFPSPPCEHLVANMARTKVTAQKSAGGKAARGDLVAKAARKAAHPPRRRINQHLCCRFKASERVASCRAGHRWEDRQETRVRPCNLACQRLVAWQATSTLGKRISQHTLLQHTLVVR